jgi:hypothetical protein
MLTPGGKLVRPGGLGAVSATLDTAPRSPAGKR